MSSIVNTGGVKNVLGEVSANDDLDSSNTTANRDGSVLERLEDLKSGGPQGNGTKVIITSNVTSSQIPNNTQTGGAITGAASGDLLLEEITISTDSTGLAGPTNLELSTDGAYGVTGAGGPILLDAISSIGANATVSSKDATAQTLPILLESGDKVYIHGDDGAGTGGGIAKVTMIFRRITDDASIAAVDLSA